MKKSSLRLLSIVFLSLVISLVPVYHLWSRADAFQANASDVVAYGSKAQAEILVEAIEDVTVASGSEVDVLQLVIDHFGSDLDKIGFYYEDLSTGEVVQIQAEQQFRTASVSKMIVLMALMDRVTLGTADLKDVVVNRLRSCR